MTVQAAQPANADLRIVITAQVWGAGAMVPGESLSVFYSYGKG